MNAVSRLRILLEARRNLLRAMSGAVRRHGDLVPLHWGASRTFLVSHPDHVRRVLEERADIYLNPGPSPRIRALLGEGLATLEGERWRRDRDLMLPAFHRERLAAMTDDIAAGAAEMIGRWREHARRGEPVDLALEARRLTMDIALRLILGQELKGEGEEFGKAWYRITDRVRGGSFGRRRDGDGIRAALDTLNTLTDRAVAARRREGGDAGDMLSMLLIARDEAGEGLSDREARDEIKNIFFGAYDTTTTTLAWAWTRLCLHPEWDERMRGEVEAVLGGRPPGFADAPRLVHTREIVQETLRLYPPAFLYGRMAAQEDELGGHPVPRGASVLLFPYRTHRHPDFWERPDEFDPGRFSPERAAGRPRFAYLPFGRGPRLCIGSNLALLEAQVVLAMTAQAFRMRLLSPPPTPERLGGVRPEEGVRVELRAL